MSAQEIVKSPVMVWKAYIVGSSFISAENGLL